MLELSVLCRCNKAAKLQCPKCLELGLPKQPSAFCSQDCFKACSINVLLLDKKCQCRQFSAFWVAAVKRTMASRQRVS